jgi:hypothetical protein
LLGNGWSKVPETEVQDGCSQGEPPFQAYAFQPRPPTIVNFGAKKLATQLTTIEGYVQFRISTDLNTSKESKNSLTLGAHEADCSFNDQYDIVYEGSTVSLAKEIILPLLGNLTVTERLVQEFGVAKTVSDHEEP